MFSDQYCITKNDPNRRNQKRDSYLLKVILDEEGRVNDLKDQELLTTAKNPHIKAQEETVNICKELRECKLEDILEQKRRQQLRANSHELRQLQTQLHSALVSKQLSEQRSFLVKQKEEEFRKKREDDEKLVNESERIRNAILQQEKEEKQKKSQLRDILQNQISECQQRRRLEFEGLIKDRVEMEKLVKSIQAQENAERQEAKRLREKCKREMEECQRDRELQRQFEQEQNIDETERHLAYQQERDEQKARRIAQTKRIQLEKQSISEQIGQQLANANNEKKKRENLLLSLLVEERKAKEDQRYRQTLEKQLKERQQLRTELENYRNEIKIQKEQKLNKEELQMREEYMRYLAERDKLDQLSDEKRRRKIIEHNKDLREMIEIKRSQRVADLSERIADFEKILSDDKAKDQLIEEERIRMLRTVPPELLRYLPPRVLKPTDRELLLLPVQKS